MGRVEEVEDKTVATANLSEHLTRVAHLMPDKKAVICPAAPGAHDFIHWSFRELEEEADRLAHGFHQAGIVKGVKTILMVRPSLELFQDQTLARDIQEPATPVKPLELPVLNVTEEERQAILKWWGDRRIRELSTDIDATYEEVRRKVGENESIATDAFNQLLKARDILIRRDAERIAQAEYYIEQVRVRLKRASESESAAKKVQWPLLGWGLFWGVIFLALLIMAGMDWFQGLFQPASQAQSLVELDVFLSAMLWGGIGGAVAVLYSLFKHIGMRDFDSQYVISYVGKPFLGLIVGATVYMILALVVRALGIVPASQATGEVETIPAIAPGVVYLVAWAAGFKENRLLELVDRVMKQVFGSSDKEEPSSEPAVPTG